MPRHTVFQLVVATPTFGSMPQPTCIAGQLRTLNTNGFRSQLRNCYSNSRADRRSLTDLCVAAAASSSTSMEGRPLKLELAPGVQLMEQQYSVAGRVLKLVAPIDVDAVLDLYINKGIDGDPYWCRVWPSAIALAQQLLQRPELVAGKKVADLGAGLGVAGIAAALAGAREVVLLDREPMALQCGLLSAAASGVAGVTGLKGLTKQQVYNQLPNMAVDNSSSGSGSRASSSSIGDSSLQQSGLTSAGLLSLAQFYMQYRSQQQQEQQQEQQQQPQQEHQQCTQPQQQQKQQLQKLHGQQHLQQPQQQHQQAAAHVQGQPLQQASSNVARPSQHSSSTAVQQKQKQQQPDAAVFRAVTFDWNTYSSKEHYDVVLACDVLYEDSAVEPVAAIVQKLLKHAPGSCLLLADPPNRTVHNRQRFLGLISAAGKPVQYLLEESWVYQCDVQQLDPEMRGGVTAETVPVQFMAFRTTVGGDTVGIKLE